jgi:hypothetical protein
MSGYAKGGGRRRLARAARRYVRARGGAANAARSAASGRSATARLGGFLSDLSSRGFSEAARALGLGNLLGRPLETVLASISNALAPDGATLEDAAARRATDETLLYLFEKYAVAAEGVQGLNAVDAAGMREALRVSVAGFVYQRWLQELGQRIEEHAVTAREAIRLERDAKAYVIEAVKLDLQGRDPLSIDWSGREGRVFIDRIYREAYSLLGT